MQLGVIENGPDINEYNSTTDDCECGCRNNLRWIERHMNRLTRQYHLNQDKLEIGSDIHANIDQKWEQYANLRIENNDCYFNFEDFLSQTYQDWELASLAVHLQKCVCCERHQTNRPHLIEEPPKTEERTYFQQFTDMFRF